MRTRPDLLPLARLTLAPFALGVAAPALAQQPPPAPERGAAAEGTERPRIEESPQDERIAAAVERELVLDPGVLPDWIDVQVEDGVVVLEGHVESVLAEQRALRIAGTVRGVRARVDLLEVRPGVELDDAQLTERVRAALRRDPATEEYEVLAVAEDGVVDLTGVVDSRAERSLVRQVVLGVRGVRAVEGGVDVETREVRSDEELRTEVEALLRSSVLVDDTRVDVSVDGGKVALTGTVGSAAERALASELAWTAGVGEVDVEGLEVRHVSRDPDLRREKYLERPDADVARALEAALQLDPRVHGFSVRTAVDDGVVTLRGVVDNLQARRAAERLARLTTGVRSVHNNLKVQASRRSDGEIEADVQAALEDAPFVDPRRVEVTAYHGTVYLTGRVDSHFQKIHADEAASRVRGVSLVVNELDLRPGTYSYDPFLDVSWFPSAFDWHTETPAQTTAADSEIAAEVRRQLRWSPFVEAESIEVQVEDGVVTLSGEVDTWVEWGVARDAAYEAGSRLVRNLLWVSVASPEEGAAVLR